MTRIERGIFYLFCATLLTLPNPAAGSSLRVRAIGDGVRIDPESGNAIEQMQTFFGPVLDPDYKEKNWVWNGPSGTISLKAARNEVVSCQVVIETERPVKGVSLRVSDLAGPGRIPAEKVKLFRQWYNHLSESLPAKGVLFPLKAGWYPDALIPFDAPAHGAPFDIPAEDFYTLDDQGNPLQRLNTQTNQAVWLDLYVPDETPPGTYLGDLLITAEGEPDRSLTLSLEVFDFTLPDEFHTTWEFMDYRRVCQGPEDLELKTRRLVKQHRVTLSSTRMMPDTIGQGYSVKLDWGSFDRRWGKYFDGSAFVEGPGKGQPVKHVLLPFDARIWREDKRRSWKGKSWPFPMPGEGKNQYFTPEYEQALIGKLLEYERHFEDRGWTGTRMMFWPDGVDEPSTHRGAVGLPPMRMARKFGELLRRSGSKRIWYRLDIGGGLWSVVDIDGDGRVEPGVLEVLNYMRDVVDVWNCHGNLLDPELLNMRPGSPWKDVWFYNGFSPSVGALTVNGESLGFRTWQWIAWKYRVGGICDWEFGVTAGINVFRQIGTDERVNIKYLRNMYVYPGEQIGLAGEPLPSIRLKMIRRSNQDYEYCRLLTDKLGDGGAAADRVVNKVVKRGLRESNPVTGPKPGEDHTHWSHRPEQWYQARLELARLIRQ